jgi:hypothetical protein
MKLATAQLSKRQIERGYSIMDAEAQTSLENWLY